MNPQHLSIEDFSYELPEDRIALHPLPERDASKLLVYKDGKITDAKYRDICDFLPENATMIFNETKVINARILFETSSGQAIELFYLSPASDISQSQALMQISGIDIKCYVGRAKKWKEEILQKALDIKGISCTLQAKIIGRESDHFIVSLSWNNDKIMFAEVLEAIGKIPLPPYIKREVEQEDAARYQTSFAKQDGSVAAPTAGLHFSKALLQKISDKGVDIAYLTLHVGAGTFKPVNAARMSEHDMHAEYYEVSRELIEKLMQAKGPVIAVGTTAMRTLESLYWLGRKLFLLRKNGSPIPVQCNYVSQWEAYEILLQEITKEQALQALLTQLEAMKEDVLRAQTQILIAPGYEFKMVDVLVTNFHQPHSTLLLLVAAFVGDDWKKLYQHALDHDYRFLSYGDGNLWWKKPQ